MTALAVDHVTVRFGTLAAVVDAPFQAEASRIHAVCGENGAGKSTLLKVAAGLLRPASGRVSIAGVPLEPFGAKRAAELGVRMVQQHFALIDSLTVLENVALGVTHPGLRAEPAGLRARLRAVFEELGVRIEEDAPVETLGVGDRQRVEIARTLVHDARVLILDEPTAVLTPGEARTLYTTLRRLADRGRAIVVVTHKLDEVRAFADDVTAMRKGRVLYSKALPIDAGERARAIDELAQALVGEAHLEPLRRTSTAAHDIVLSLEHVSAPPLADVSLQVHAGEIVGIAGVEGNGQHELIEVLARIRRRAVPRRELADASRERIEGGPCVVVHADRQTDGLVLDATLRDNLVLGELGAFCHAGWIDQGKLDAAVSTRFAHARVQSSLDAPARSLSGGNQQRIVLARAFARLDAGARVLVLAHPTRGVDMAAAHSIHKDIFDAAARHVGVILISSDLDELRTLSHRILVLFRGRFVGEFSPDASDQDLGRAMLGTSVARGAA